jgi:uncharacterized RDD family membrane protein YckC
MIDDQLYTVETPEQIDLVYDVAGIGSRILAALIDHVLILLILSLGYVVVTLLIERLIDILDTGLVVGIFSILVFLFMCAYYIFFETTWNGQTPGKRMVGIRMVRIGGRPLGFLGSTIRNFIRLADFLPILYGVGVGVMFVDRQSRRLGDMAAGALAVRERKAVTLDMLVAAPAAEAPVVMAAAELRIPNLRALRAQDFGIVETYLRQRTQVSPEARTRIDDLILEGLERRLGYPVQRDTYNVEQFLLRVAAEHQLLLRAPATVDANNGAHAATMLAVVHPEPAQVPVGQAIEPSGSTTIVAEPTPQGDVIATAQPPLERDPALRDES